MSDPSGYLPEHGQDMIPVRLIDLLSAVARMEQVQAERAHDLIAGMAYERLFTCDLPRLRAYLPAEAVAEIEELS